MHKFIAYIGFACSIYSLMIGGALVYVFYASSYGVVGVDLNFFVFHNSAAGVTALLLGGISRFMSHRKGVPHVLAAKLGVLMGALALVILIAILMFSG